MKRMIDLHGTIGGRMLAVIALLLSAAGCAVEGPPAGDPYLTTRAGELVWDIWLAPDPPRQKDTSIWLGVRRADRESLQPASIRSTYLMPAMGSMPEMRGQGSVTEAGGGYYRVSFDFPMQGTWTLNLAVDSSDSRATAEYSLTTGTLGIREISVSGSSAEDESGQQVLDTPATREGQKTIDTGVIRISGERRQEIGVRTATIEIRPVDVTIRTVATVTYDETRLRDVTLKNRGWIERLLVEETGQEVRRGQTLFTLYSPELLSAQEELLSALASQERARESEAPERADYLVDAARRRLSLWDLSSAQIDEIIRSGRSIQHLAVPSPASGFVVEKNVVEGAAVEPGQTLYRIADLSSLWLEADVYESELPLVEVGQRAVVTFPYLPGRKLEARVGYVYPYLERGSRTGKVRLELPNPDLELKPDMYADVVLRAFRGERVVVPEEAVIYAGPRRLVFVDLGGGRLQPRTVELGVKSGDAYEVFSGLEAGDVVVTSGNFLVAAESRLKSATEKW